MMRHEPPTDDGGDDGQHRERDHLVAGRQDQPEGEHRDRAGGGGRPQQIAGGGRNLERQKDRADRQPDPERMRCDEGDGLHGRYSAGRGADGAPGRGGGTPPPAPAPLADCTRAPMPAREPTSELSSAGTITVFCWLDWARRAKASTYFWAMK